MLRVLRTRPGSVVRLFDGAGREGDFLVLETGKSKAVLEASTLREHPAGSGEVWLALGWGKSSRRGYLLEKSVELHAAGIAFWQAEFSQGRLPKAPKESWHDRCVQAAKQCGSLFLPALEMVQGGCEGLAEYGRKFDRMILAWENESDQLLSPDFFGKGKTLVVIGPEGGIAEREASLLIDRGFTAMSLGGSILRWETAALHCLSLSFFARESSKR